MPDAAIGKRVLITGASSGIGCAAARAFARAGADVALVARSRERAWRRRRRRRARAAWPRTSSSPTSAAASAAEAAVAEAVAALGGARRARLERRVDGLRALQRTSRPEDFDRTIDVTFRAAVDTIRAALPHLERSRGTIVATGSVIARVPLPRFGSYAAAKHALRGFLGSLRIELRERREPRLGLHGPPGPGGHPAVAQRRERHGREPRNPPDTYSPEAIAGALVACAIRPRAEITVGREGRAIEVAVRGRAAGRRPRAAAA